MAISGADAPFRIQAATGVRATEPPGPPPARKTADARRAGAGAAATDGKDEAAAVHEARRPVELPDFPARDLAFRYDKELNRVIVQVLDAETHEVVRSIPPEEIVNALKQLRRLRGALVDEEA
jgi:flagellar protein FlaG